MSDIVSQLQNILGSKEGQDKLKSITDMLGGSQGENNDLDLSSLSSLFSNGSNEDKSEPPPSNIGSEEADAGGFDFSGIDINMIMKAQQLLSGMNKEDNNTMLIKALKPHIKPERSHKIDEALKIMQLISMLPLLKDSGILGSFFGGDKK